MANQTTATEDCSEPRQIARCVSDSGDLAGMNPSSGCSGGIEYAHIEDISAEGWDLTEWALSEEDETEILQHGEHHETELEDSDPLNDSMHRDADALATADDESALAASVRSLPSATDSDDEDWTHDDGDSVADITTSLEEENDRLRQTVCELQWTLAKARRQREEDEQTVFRLGRSGQRVQHEGSGEHVADFRIEPGSVHGVRLISFHAYQQQMNAKARIIADLESEKQTQLREAASLASQVERLEAMLEVFQKSYRAAVDKNLENREKVEDLEDFVDELQSLAATRKRIIHTLYTKLDVATLRQPELEEQLDALQDDILALTAQHEDDESALAQANAGLAAAQQHVSSLETDLAASRQSAGQHREDSTRFRAERNALRATLATATQQAHALSAATAQLEAQAAGWARERAHMVQHGLLVGGLLAELRAKHAALLLEGRKGAEGPSPDLLAL